MPSSSYEGIQRWPKLQRGGLVGLEREEKDKRGMMRMWMPGCKAIEPENYGF